MALFFITLLGVSIAYSLVHGRSWGASVTFAFDQPWEIGRFVIGSIALPIATIAMHEAIHGLAFKFFDGNPRYGVGVKYLLPYAYATAPGQQFSRNAFLGILLAPLVVMNSVAAGLILLFPQLTWLIWVIALNTSGAIGDIWFAAIALRYPASTSIEDLQEGFAIYAPYDVAHRLLTRPPHRSSKLRILGNLAGLAVAMFVLLNLTSVLLLILLDLFGVPTFQLSIGNWTLFHWVKEEESFGLFFSPLAVGGLSVLLAWVMFSFRYSLKRQN
ncbi:MAG: DUF3267 domain-containing protein [Cyanobacteria bacterium J06638_20]